MELPCGAGVATDPTAFGGRTSPAAPPPDGALVWAPPCCTPKSGMMGTGEALCGEDAMGTELGLMPAPSICAAAPWVGGEPAGE